MFAELTNPCKNSTVVFLSIKNKKNKETDSALHCESKKHEVVIPSLSLPWKTHIEIEELSIVKTDE